MDKKTLIGTVDGLFSKRSPFMSLCQEISDNFYPERSGFTVNLTHGEQFAGNLMTSYPVIIRRTLADQIGVMLRPTAKDWFHVKPQDMERETYDAKKWLERATTIQRRAMYDPRSLFTRATKEGDNDFACFGQAVISVRPNRSMDALLYRNWHIKDVVWKEDAEGAIHLVARKWDAEAHELVGFFKDKVHQNIKNKLAKEPFSTTKCYHIVCAIDLYDGVGQNSPAKAGDKPYWSIYYDCENEHIIEAVPVYNKEYIIPRWQTVSGSQYAFSPATIAALPDARLIQAMTYTLLEAGEKATNPPMVATMDAIRSDIAIYAGGVTWADLEYDERHGAALRPIDQDLRGLPIGVDMQRDARGMLMQAFYLNKLNIPERGPEMTAYEVGQRIQEYIRGAIPIFEPMEMGYNGELCDITFDILLRLGAFGSPQDIPLSLQGADIQFRFESPLHNAIEEQKGAKLTEMRDIIAVAAEIDQNVTMMPDMRVALRDALQGIAVPTGWIHSEEDYDKSTLARQKQAEMQQQLEIAQQGANVAATASQVEPEKIDSILERTA